MSQTGSFQSQQEFDPMLFEAMMTTVANAMVASQEYVPVSKDWALREAAADKFPALLHPTVEFENPHSPAAMGHDGPVDKIVVVVGSLELVANNGSYKIAAPITGPGGPTEPVDFQIEDSNTTSGSHHLVGVMFADIPASALPALSYQRCKANTHFASAEPSRRSSRQATNKTAILVSKRATSCLIQQLELVGPGDKIDSDAQKKFEELFQGPLAPQSIAAIHVATRLADDQIMKAAAAMAANELAAQVEASVF
jgi:hypothetical protein